MKRIVCIVVLSAPGLGMGDAPTEFNRYRTILDRNPFVGGDVEAASSAPVSPTPPTPSVVGRYKVTAIIEIYRDDEPQAVVGLVDRQNGRSFLLSADRNYEDLELVSADYENQVVFLKSNDEAFAISLVSGSANVVSAVPEVAARRPGVKGTPNPRAEAAMAMRRARYAQPPAPVDASQAMQ